MATPFGEAIRFHHLLSTTAPNTAKTRECHVSFRTNCAATLDQGEDIEKAFLDQAYGQIALKAQPIMKAPFRVGFEIVNKNDTNTRMAGIFIFRINGELLFAPVFFINGNIKGTDLLYRHTPKRFVPLTNDWADYLLGVHSQEEGRGVPRTERSKSRNQLDLRQIVHPPSLFGSQTGSSYGTRKYASFAEQLSPEDRAKWDEFTKNATEIPAPKEGSILKRFIVEAGGISAINRLVATCGHNLKFANAMMLGSTPENYMPDLPPPTFVPGPRKLLVFHSAPLKNANVKQASLKAPDMCRGFVIDDFRKEADGEVNLDIYEDPQPTLHTIGHPGCYDVMASDNSMRPMIFAYEQSYDARIPSFYGNCSPMYPSSAHGSNRVFVAIDVQTKNSATVDNHQMKNLFGQMTEGDPAKSPEAIDVGSMQTGKAYRIYDGRKHSLSSPFVVLSSTTDGIKRFEISNGYSTSSFLVYNADYDKSDPTEQLVGNCCKAFEVEMHEEKENFSPCGPRKRFGDKMLFGGKTQLEDFIFGQGFGKGKIKKASTGGYLFKTVGSGPFFTRPMNKMAATAYLMSRCHVRQDLAEAMLKKADAINVNWGKVESDAAGSKVAAAFKTEEFSFLYNPLEKTAAMGANMRFNDWPDFEAKTHNEFGVLEEPFSQHLLRIERDYPDIIRSRIGDRWDQGTGENASQIDTATPLELYSQSQEKGIGSMFEHGVVGELLKTYDAGNMVDKYLPDLEEGLDRLGRILFLFYWKPEDFSKAYGTDDQDQMENKLISNFKSLGDLP